MGLVFNFEIFCVERIFVHRSSNFYHLVAHGIIDFDGIYRFTLFMQLNLIKGNFLFFILFSTVSRLYILNNEIFIFIQKTVVFFHLFLISLTACFDMSFFLIDLKMNCLYEHFLDFYFMTISLSLFYLHFVYLMSKICCSDFAGLNLINCLFAFKV